MSLKYLFELKRRAHYDEALQEIERLRAQGHPVLVEEADIRARKGQAKQALELLEQARLGGPLPEYARALLAGLYEHCGREEEARVIFEELAGHSRLAPAVARRVTRFFQKRDPERAVSLASSWAGEDDTEWLARVLLEARLKEDAKNLLAGAVERNPKNDRLLGLLLELQLEGEDPAVAAEEFETLLTLRQHKESYALKTRLVQKYRQAGELEKARDLLLSLLRTRPDELYLLSNLAYVQRDLGEIDTALELFERVMASQPGDQYAENAYFSTCRRHDRKERAAAFVAQRTKAHPEERRLWGLLKKFCP